MKTEAENYPVHTHTPPNALIKSLLQITTLWKDTDCFRENTLSRAVVAQCQSLLALITLEIVFPSITKHFLKM